MKKKTGFTLAEVLITLAIIGIIAALVLPALLNNFQFRAVGTRLSKFMSTVENNARAWVESDTALDPGVGFNLDRYINDSFAMTDILAAFQQLNQNTNRNEFTFPAANIVNGNGAIGTFENRIATMTIGAGSNNPAAVGLKDGTRVDFYALNNITDNIWPANRMLPNQGQIGVPVLGMVFDPAANALPNTVRRTFLFVITSLGYVFPSPNDNCTWDLYNNRWRTSPADFAVGTACDAAASLVGTAAQQQQGGNNNNNNNGGN